MLKEGNEIYQYKLKEKIMRQKSLAYGYFHCFLGMLHI